MPGKKKKKDEAAEGEAGAEAPEKAKGGKGKTMLLSAALVIAGAAGQKFVLSSAPAQVIIAPPVDGGIETSSAAHGVDCTSVQAATTSETQTPHAKRGAAAATGGTTDLSSMTINLADGHYLKVGITVELGDTVLPEEFAAESAKASDVVLSYFSTKTMDQLTSDKHAGIKVELTCLIQEAYAESTTATTAAKDAQPMVIGVLFREFLTS